MEQLNFYFGKEINEKDLYSKEKGYGFVDALNLEGKTDSEKSLYMGGWNLRKSADCYESAYTSTNEGVYISKSRYVLVFRCDVQNEGIYRVYIKTKADNGPITDMRLFAGRRNMMARNINLKEGDIVERSFLTTVYPYIPAMTSVPNEQKSVYISVSGKNAGLTSISIEEVKDVKTLWIAGDSTLTDQNAGFPYYSYGSCAGWAQEMAGYFENIAVNNQAHSGMTSNCFRDDGHWDIVYSRIKEGDIFMLQFGHN
ncbi:MAG: hypothetical protein K6A23_02435, partial [Butyrivibrio sp.]|nr:hypothetical protein [Butyrivibrio sp.]